MIYWGVTLTMIALTLLAGGVVFFNIIYQKRLWRKQQQLYEAESNHKTTLIKTIIDVTEQERKRIASELHDDIGSVLSSIKMSLNMIKQNSVANDDIYNLLTECKTTVDQTVDRTRQIAYNLMPPGLEKFGLMQTLEDFCFKLTQQTKIEVDLNLQLPNRLQNTASLALYRIIQELTTNTIKYADASVVEISILTSGEHLKLQYMDNGKGFDNTSGNHYHGMGLQNIESRIISMKGNHTIDTKEKAGFRITVLIPLNQIS